MRFRRPSQSQHLPSQADVGTELSTHNTDTAPLLSASLSTPDWHSPNLPDWTTYHRQLARTANPDSMHPPSAFQAHQVCWEVLASVVVQHITGPPRAPPNTIPTQTWLHRFVEQWCRATWQPLHHHFVCQREAWRRRNHQTVMTRVWALANNHGLNVLGSGM